MIGVKFADVLLERGMRQMRTVGQVTADETRIAHVHTRVEGWIERVLVDFTGDVVRKGQPLLTVYSPEMLASQQELLLAARARTTMAASPLDEAARHGDSLFAASRRRLQLLDLSDAQIDQVLATGVPIRSVSVEAPVSGYVTERNAFPNQRVTPESDLYTIVDLSHVWVLADIFESDSRVHHARRAREGHPALRRPGPAHRAHQLCTTAGRPDDTRAEGAARRAQPGLEAEARTCTSTWKSASHRRSASPCRPTPYWTRAGDRRFSLIAATAILEPRSVKAGERTGDRVTILSGLTVGERVVASGTFLVDSESQLKAAAAGMGAPLPPAHAPAGAGAPKAEPRHD